MRSPYDVLRVEPEADDEELRDAYRERVKETHPDLGGDEDEFRLVVGAYEALLGVDRPDEDGDGGMAAWGEPRPRHVAPRGRHARVEYLDYEALKDHGWSLDDDGLFERAADAGLDGEDFGEFHVTPDESLLEAAERSGFAWPFACRGGACANCAVALLDGELSQPVDHILPDDLVEAGFRLSCNGLARSEHLRVVYNVKHLPKLDELRLPPYPFESAQRAP